MKRLTRSNEKIIAGVISGISNYINPEWDPVFLRLAFIWITFYNPALILIYFGLYCVKLLPEVSLDWCFGLPVLKSSVTRCFSEALFA